MKWLLLLLLMLFAVACSEAGMEIKNSENIKKDAQNTIIKTTRIEDYEEKEEAKPVPSLSILYPKESQLVKNSTVVAAVEISNFTIVPLDRQPRDYHGHIHYWLDGVKIISEKKSEVFYDVAHGNHKITVELVKSNHSSLNPQVIKSVDFEVELQSKDEVDAAESGLTSYLREYTIEADDYGFYPAKISAAIGDNVSIQFKFRDHLIYYAGLDIFGPFPDINYRKGINQPINRSFTINEKTIIKSFWPSSGVKKAEMIVEIDNK